MRAPGITLLLATALAAGNVLADTAPPDTSAAPLVDVSLWPPELTTLGAAWSPQVRINDRIGWGVGAEILVPYRLAPDPASPVSSVSCYLMWTTKGQWRANLANDLYWGQGRYYARARLDHDDLARRFFGIGPMASGADADVYRPQSTLAYVEGSRELGGGLAAGLRLEGHRQAIHDVEPGSGLARADLRGREAGWVVGGGFIASYDRRDCRLQPCRGLYAQAMGLAFLDRLGDHAFQIFNLDLRGYASVGREQTLAAQLFYYGVAGDPPFWRLASLGGRDHSRAYDRDRWLDDVLASAQVEWRWRFSPRLGVASFAGAAVVGAGVSDLRADHLRPSLGIGLRAYPGLERATVPVRLDLAIGHREWRAILAVGEAF